MFDAEKLNTYVLHHAPMMKDQGLFHGKIGVAIYLFHLGRQSGNPVYTEFAETLIDDVYSNLENGILMENFESGLAGIGWGFDYLKRNGFVEADLDDILTEVDDRVFRALSFNKISDISVRQGLTGLGLYLVSRLKDKEETMYTDRDILLKSLLVKCLNKLYDALEENANQLEEPEIHDLLWSLPALLWFLKEAVCLNVYNHKINIIAGSISSKVLSTLPVLHAHRLFLSTAVEEFLASGIAALPGWREYADLLKSSIDREKCLDEFLDKEISVAHGISGVFYLDMFDNSNSCFMDNHKGRVEESEFWNLKTYPLGLLNGLSGVLFVRSRLLDSHKTVLN